MIILSLADDTYRERLLFSMKQSERLGYKTVVYDVGGLGFGKVYTIPKEVSNVDAAKRAHICMTKPLVMFDALNNTNETVVFLDADAFLVDTIDEIETDDYDVGVTYKGGEKNTYINAGVVFLKQTNKARDFLQMWIDKIKKAEERVKTIKKTQLGDQIFLNDLVFSHVSKGSLLNKVKDVEGVRVKFFDYRDYNHFNLSSLEGTVVKSIPNNTKIVHIRHAGILQFKRVINKWRM